MSLFQHIVVATDLGDLLEPALARALELARPFQARITLLHVTQTPPYHQLAYAEGLAWPVEELETRARAALDAALVSARSRYEKVDSAIVAGRPRTRIVEAAVEQKADLIVIGTHGRRGLARAVLGSVAEAVVRTSPIPVLTVSG